MTEWRTILEVEKIYTARYLKAITAPDPAHYGRDIVIGKIEYGCKYCGNKSSRTDVRGNCISCGAPLEDDND